MDILFWILIIACFIISFIGLVYPIIPSVVFIALGIAIYGFAYGFDSFSILFWSIQILFFILLLAADYLTNLFGIKKFGGSKAAIWGSTIGLLIGPFVIPVAGIIIGPFAGAIIGELIVHKTEFKKAVKIGIGSLLGFLSGVITKGIIQSIMIGYFIVVVL